MSAYNPSRVNGSIFSGDSVVSVGASLAAPRYIAPGAPSYERATREAVDEIRRLAAEDAARRRDAQAILLPHALDADSMALLVQLYPEYQLKPLMMYKPVSSLWQAHRFMAINLCIDAVKAYSPDVIVVGNAAFQSASRGLKGIHVELCPESAYAAHDYHEGGMNLVSALRASAHIQTQTSVQMPMDAMSRLSGDLRVCVKRCALNASAMVFDLSTYSFSLMQAANAMYEAQAGVAQAFMPYTPEVFRGDTGVLCEASGVDFSVEHGRLILMYREGPAGVTDIRLSVWNDWLRTSTVRVTGRFGPRYYRLELMQTRGPFIYGRIVRCAEEAGVPGGVIRHALEMPWAQDKLIMTVSRLRSLRDDPTNPAAWAAHTTVVSASTVRKLYEYALGLSQEEFSPEAIMKRAHVIDTRTVTKGVNLRLRMPMEPLLARDMSVAIYTKAFVVRYRMGRLSAELTRELKRITRFSSGSTLERMSAVAAACSQRFWEATASRVVTALRDALARWYSSLTGLMRSKEPVFDIAPRFLLMEEYNNWYMSRCASVLKDCAQAYVTMPTARGAINAARQERPSRDEVLMSLPRVDETSIGHVSGELIDDIIDMSESTYVNEDVEMMVSALKQTHDISHSAESRFELRKVMRVPAVPQGHFGDEDFDYISDPAGTINVTMEQVFPGMHVQEFSIDASSMRFDPQHREFDGNITLPVDDPTSMAPTSVYKSRLTCYNVERKAQSLGETLTALSARTMSAPQMRVASDEDNRVRIVWQHMKDAYFRPDADEDLNKYASDSVGFEEELLREWGGKATPANVKKVIKSVLEQGAVFETSRPWEFEMMMKADAKPPMSTKPLHSVLAPQLIVMQDKLTNALYSSIFRVMARRFDSLLRPEVMVNLLKSLSDIRDHIAANHPWRETLQYLENDFSKFDKSQDAFSYKLVVYVCEQLGFNKELLDRWRDANETCTLRSLILMIVVTVHDQNKSGGPATAFMNAISNMGAVATCYAGTKIVWATFMGDDSLVACRTLVASQRSLNMMMEWFNFEAKFFVLKYPYFTSCFVLFDEDAQKVHMVPDPVKRAQKLSVSVSSVDPKWDDKFKALNETLVSYRHLRDLVSFPEAISERYGLHVGTDLLPMIHALATVSSDFDSYRSLYDSDATFVHL